MYTVMLFALYVIVKFKTTHLTKLDSVTFIFSIMRFYGLVRVFIAQGMIQWLKADHKL